MSTVIHRRWYVAGGRRGRARYHAYIDADGERPLDVLCAACSAVTMLDMARRGGKNPSCAARLPSCAASSTALRSSELGTLSGMARTDDAGRLAEIVRIMGMDADS